LEEGRLGVVVSFLAMLELLKDKVIEFVQVVPFGPIHIKVAQHERTVSLELVKD
jgi:segregation and condensation protein A